MKEKIEVIPFRKGNYEGIFKVNWESKDVDDILKEALEERNKKWLKDILT